MSNKVCFISSSGGHYTQLKIIIDELNIKDYFIVTERNDKILKQQSNTFYLMQFNRKSIFSIFVFIKNLFSSLNILLSQNPKIIISTGAGGTIPFCLLAKLLRKKIIYIESFAKRTTPTITGRVMYKIANKFYVQWPELLNEFPKAEYKGAIY
jgi:beta-1,4-N-acetylglucosaminyltransferase